jgi:ATP-dependent DNA ligase
LGRFCDDPKYPDIAVAIGALNCRQAYVDGELCAVRPDGTTSFADLQGHLDAPAELRISRSICCISTARF